MAKKPSPVPHDIPTLAPAVGVKDASVAIDWYRRVFGAKETLRLTAPDGAIVHAELNLGGSILMLGEESEEQGNPAPPTIGGTPVRLHLYVEDVDALFSRATREGAEVLIDVADQFYGHRAGRFKDPFGHVWIVASRIEEMSPDEMQTRMDQLFG